jgi:hypothetical protein
MKFPIRKSLHCLPVKTDALLQKHPIENLPLSTIYIHKSKTIVHLFWYDVKHMPITSW